MAPKSLQNRGPGGGPRARGLKIAPKGGQDGDKIEKKCQRNKKEGSILPRCSFLPEKVAKMAPTWPPKRSQNGPKIDAKIDQNFDGFRDRFLEGFWWILGAKMEPSWGKNGMENRYRR